MKLKFLLIIFLNFFLFNVSLASNVGFIDLNYIINNSNAGKNIINKLEKINSENINILKNEQLLLVNEREEIEKKKNILSKDELNNLIVVLNDKFNKFNLKQEDMSVKFNELRQIEINNFVKKINPIIEKFMIDNNIDMILKKESIYISQSKFDITKELLQLVNTKFDK